MSTIASAFLAILREHQSRVLITGLALVLIILAGRIPAPGIPREMLQAALAPLTMNAYWAWVIPAVVAETVLLIYYNFFHVGPYAAGGVNPLARWIAVIAILISYVHGYYAASVFFSVYDAGDGLVRNFGLGVIAASVAAGTALTIALARWIETRGIGNGFWVVIGLYTVAGTVNSFEELPAMFAQGATSMKSLAVEGAMWLFLIVLAVAAVRLYESNGHRNWGALLWPWLLAEFLGSLAATALILIASLMQAFWFNDYVYPAKLTAEFLIFVACAWLYLRREGNWRLGVIVLGAFCGLFILPVLMTYLNLRALSFDGFLIVLLALFLSRLQDDVLGRVKMSRLKRQFRQASDIDGIRQ